LIGWFYYFFIKIFLYYYNQYDLLIEEKKNKKFKWKISTYKAKIKKVFVIKNYIAIWDLMRRQNFIYLFIYLFIYSYIH